MEKHLYYSDWYAENRERLLPIRRRYNKGYSQRSDVIERAKIKNATPEAKEKRKQYKKSLAGKASNKKYEENNKEKIKSWSQIRRLQRYSLTPKDVEEMRLNQKEKCKICFALFNGKFHIDHCHKTNKVRGLLCTCCNMALGLLKDDVGRMESAIRYLKNEVHSNNGS